MTTDSEESKFLLIQNELCLGAKGKVEVIEDLLSRVTDERQKLAEMVAQYQVQRLIFLTAQLKAKQLTWCTQCLAVISMTEVKIILLEGTRRITRGYENSECAFEDYSYYARLCPKCLEKAQDQHGFTGEYNKALRRQTRYLAFEVEWAENCFKAKKFGSWVTLSSEFKPPDLPDKLADQLSKQWGLAPKMELNGTKLVIHQKDPMGA